MSNTESSAISRLISQAHGGVTVEPVRPDPRRLARGTVAPTAALPTPRPEAARAPSSHDAWYVSDEDLVEDESDGDDEAFDIDVAPDDTARQERVERTPLPRPILEVGDQTDSIAALASHARKLDARVLESDPATAEFEARMSRRKTRLAWVGGIVLFAGLGAGVYALQQQDPEVPARAAEAVTGAVTQPVTVAAAVPGAVTAPVTMPAAAAAPAGAAAAEPAAAAAPAPVAETAPVAVGPATAGFELRGLPATAAVTLDGQPLGAGPMRVMQLTPGKHHLEIAAPAGFINQSLEIDLPADEVAKLRVELEPETVAAAPQPKRAAPRAEKPARAPREKAVASSSGGKGVLMVNAKPPCEIIVDGKKTGLFTPQRELELSPGKHTITLQNKQLGVKKNATVKVVAGKPTKLVVDLTDQMD